MIHKVHFKPNFNELHLLWYDTSYNLLWKLLAFIEFQFWNSFSFHFLDNGWNWKKMILVYSCEQNQITLKALKFMSHLRRKKNTIPVGNQLVERALPMSTYRWIITKSTLEGIEKIIRHILISSIWFEVLPALLWASMHFQKLSFHVIQLSECWWFVGTVMLIDASKHFNIIK